MIKRDKSNNELLALPVGFSFAFFAEAIYFEKMERVILKNIPNSFTEELLELFQDSPFEYKFLTSSLIRSSDFLHYYNSEHGLKTVALAKKRMNQDIGKKINQEFVIPFSILKKYYKQRPLAKSQSKNLLETIKDAKDIGADGDLIKYKIYSFYTLWGFMFTKDEEIADFEFLDFIHSKKGRELITKKIEELSILLSNKAGFEISPIYLDFSMDLNSMVDEIDAFIDYSDKKKIYFPSDAREYSLYKRKKQFFGLF